MKATQLCLSDGLKAKPIHGGEYAIGKRKTRRPVVTKRPMHLVMRSSLATGSRSFLQRMHVRFIQNLVQTLSQANEIRIYEFSINGNHLHFLLQAKSIAGFQRFVRVLTGQIAMKVGGGKKGHPSEESFWDLPPFTRIVEWGRAFQIARQYVVQNTLEVLGLIPYQPRKASKPSRRRSYALGASGG